MRFPLLLPATIATVCCACGAQSAITPTCTLPDTIFVHGNIVTGAHLKADDLSPTPARISAIAVCNGLILAIGSDAEMLARKAQRTTVVDLGGAFAMPGFNDAHVHLLSAGRQKVLSVDLDHTQSLAEMQQRIARYAASAAPGSWIVGSGWDQTAWKGGALPTRGEIDAVTADHPALFYRTDGHILVANSAALPRRRSRRAHRILPAAHSTAVLRVT